MVRKGNNKRNGKRTGPKVIQYKTGKPTPRPRGSVGFATGQQDLAQVHSITNPFCDEARGAKVPDDDSTKSIPVSIWDVQSYPSIGTRFGVAIQPALLNNTYLALTMDGTKILTWQAGANITDYNALTAGIQAFRIVSWGVRVYSTLPPTQQSGYYRFITVPESAFATPFTYASSLFEEVKAYPLTDTTVHWISKPIGTTWKEYKAYNTTMDWERLVVVADGLPSSVAGAITVEVVFNIEAQPNLGSITGALSTQALPHKPHVLSAAAQTLAKHAGSHIQRNFGDVIKTFGKRALDAAVSYFMPAYRPGMKMLTG
jgi:hypothetical protein